MSVCVDQEQQVKNTQLSVCACVLGNGGGT